MKAKIEGKTSDGRSVPGSTTGNNVEVTGIYLVINDVICTRLVATL
jgi:hypothetical protein